MSTEPATGHETAVPVRIAMPAQLCDLARVTGPVTVEVAPPVTVGATLDALEAALPALAGTIRRPDTGARRPLIRIYADGEDYSSAPLATELPARVVDGHEPLRLVGSIAGG